MKMKSLLKVFRSALRSDRSASMPPYIAEYKVTADFRLGERHIRHRGLLGLQVLSVNDSESRIYTIWQSKARFDVAKAKILKTLQKGHADLKIEWSAPQVELDIRRETFWRLKTCYSAIFGLVAVIGAVTVIINTQQLLFTSGHIERISESMHNAVAGKPQDLRITCQNIGSAPIRRWAFSKASLRDVEGAVTLLPTPPQQLGIGSGDKATVEIKIPSMLPGDYNLHLAGNIFAGLLRSAEKFILQDTLRVWEALRCGTPVLATYNSRRADVRITTHVGEEFVRGLRMSAILQSDGGVQIYDVSSSVRDISEESLTCGTVSKLTWVTMRVGPTETIETTLVLISDTDKTEEQWNKLCGKLKLFCLEKLEN